MFSEIINSLAPRNAIWSKYASFLIVLCATKPQRQGKYTKSESNYQRYDENTDFSVGISFGLFLAELTKSDLQAHPMAGFDKNNISDLLALPKCLQPLVVIAVGREIPYDETVHVDFDEQLFTRMRVVRVRKPLDQIACISQ